eukprot:gene12074-13992_t
MAMKAAETGDEIEMAIRSNTETNDGSSERFIGEHDEDEMTEAKAPSSFNVYGHTESHQFEQNESEVWWHHQLQRHFEDKGNWWTFARQSDITRWFLTLITGLFCGIVALAVTYGTKLLTTYKFRTFNQLLEKEKNEELPFGSAYAFLFAMNIIFGVVAWTTVFIEPLAAGSGIPEVKCYLNGVDIPRLVRFKTLLCKTVGIVFAVSAGLPVGKEGPMVHAGAIVAAEVSQGRTFLCGMDTTFSKFQDFRNDAEKRDFVACGTAAGVAAAFGAPIGGVLFSLEEGSSFWSTKLTWRAFFCAMVTVFTLYVANTAHSMFGHSEKGAMFSFGEFYSLRGEQSNYAVWELGLFMGMGLLGGLIGAYFNTCVMMIFQWRAENVRSRTLKLVEVIIVVALMSVIALGSPLMWHKCTPLPVVTADWSEQERSLVADLVPLYCNKKTHYNELASLYLADSDVVIRQLFHFREVGDQNDLTFTSASLFLFFVPYLIMACVTYGTAVPAGMFVPSLTSGAAFGRLIGHFLHTMDNTRGTFADSGTYALMGAIAITGGIARMTISLTVMVLEATGDMQYVLPLMLTVMTARWIGNLFTEGIYDMHIRTRRLDYLDEDESVSRLVQLHDLTISDIMTKRPFYMLPVMRVGEFYDILIKAKHNCFPVVESDESNILVGSILRKTICTLLKHKAFAPSHAGPSHTGTGAPPQRLFPLVAWGTLECTYPRYPHVDQLNLSDADRECWLDLRPYLDSAPFTMNEHASVQRAYRVFRTLGLRHLIVTNTHNQVLGMVTRHDLVSTHYLASSHGGSTNRREHDRGLNSSSATLTSWSSGNSLDTAGDAASANGSTRERRRNQPQRMRKQRASRVHSINNTIGVDLTLETSIDV